MDTRARKAIELAVLDYLQSCTVGQFGLSSDSRESFWKLEAVLGKYVGTFVESTSFANVLRDQMHTQVISNIDIFPYGSPATALLRNDQLETAVQGVATWVCELPRKYNFYFPLPNLPNYGRGEIALSADIGFREFSSDQSATFYQRRHLEGVCFDDVNDLTHAISSTTSYLHISGSGFFDGFTYSSALAEAIGRAKRFLFLIMQTSNCFADLWPENARVGTGFVIENELENGAVFVVPSSIARCLDTFRVEPWYESVDGARLDGEALTEELKTDFARVLHLERNCETSESILTACEWAFDSYYEANDSIAYIFLSIAFESLLGSPGGASSLTEVLAERLALITASSHTEREQFRGTFRKFYQTRSKIAHGKKSRLAPDERDLLKWGWTTFARALAHEVDLPVDDD